MESTISETNEVLSGSSATDLDGKYLTFWTDGLLLAVPVANVIQIIGMQDITAMPEYPFYAKGIINLRGNVIPVIDVRLRLGKSEAEYTDKACIIIAGIRDKYFGFLVDEVDEVADISPEDISNPPKMGASAVPCLTGIAHEKRGVILIVDTALLLGEDNYQALSESL